MTTFGSNVIHGAAAPVGRVIPNAPVALGPHEHPESQRRVKDNPPYLNSLGAPRFC